MIVVLSRACGQERDEVFEVAGEPGAMTGKGNGLDVDAVGGEGQTPQVGTDDHEVGTEVQVPPAGGFPAGVVAGPGGELTAGAG